MLTNILNIFKKQTFDDVLIEFSDFRKIGSSKRAFEGTSGQLKIFSNWLKENHYSNLSISKINSLIISKFFIFLATEKNLDRSTCQRYFLNVRLLFKYAKKKNYIKIIPFDQVQFPLKKEDGGAQVILKNDLVLLLSEIKKRNFQLYVACMMEYYCFIRPGRELRLMKVNQIDLNLGIIRIPATLAKNKRSEVVTIPTQMIEILKEYGIESADKNFYVFGKKQHPGPKPWSVNALSSKFREIRDDLNLSTGYKFYSFKHTGATMLHESGAPMRALMDQLRHTKLDATQHYLKKHAGITDDHIKFNFPDPFKT